MNQQKPNIFEYLSYRNFLKEMYTFKKDEKGSFSFRSFAKAAGLSSSNFLKLVMEGKRNLSAEGILKFARAFKLNKEETHFFETLVHFDQAQKAEEKNFYYERILQSRTYQDIHALEAHQYAYFSNWIFVALRELVALKNFQEDPKWVNRKLGTKLHPEEIKRGFQILQELRLLVREQGQLKQTEEKITITPEMGSLALVNFHREMLRKASESLEKSRTLHRDISALTVPVSKKQYERIKERIQQFRREIHAIASEVGEKEAVYQVNFQLFNLSEVLWD